jgi:hypothetical protein
MRYTPCASCTSDDDDEYGDFPFMPDDDKYGQNLPEPTAEDALGSEPAPA